MPTTFSSQNINHESFIFKYTLSATAAVVAESVTYPLDLTKTRLQIQGEFSQGVHGKSSHHRGMIATAVGIAREEGVRKLWQGVTPALYRHIVYSGCRMSFYEMLREKVFKRGKDGAFPVWKASMAGLLSGAAAQFISSPTDLVKVQMQMEGKRRLEGKPTRVKNTLHAFQQIVAEGGVRKLWTGWVPNVQRAALVNLGGIVAALMGTPADVIKTRIMNQPTKDGKGLLYSGSVDCLVKTVRLEGFFALYKGFLPIWARMAPWSLVFWLSYEEVRKLAGTSSF